jgi:hypothetical protein
MDEKEITESIAVGENYPPIEVSFFNFFSYATISRSIGTAISCLNCQSKNP